jgi:hypothetical protein
MSYIIAIKNTYPVDPLSTELVFKFYFVDKCIHELYTSSVSKEEAKRFKDIKEAQDIISELQEELATWRAAWRKTESKAITKFSIRQIIEL